MRIAFYLKMATTNLHRITEIDIMKGIAILCVMIGHTCWIPCIRTFIYSFHIPLFFLVSGYFAKTYHTDNDDFKGFVSRNAKQLLIPYLVLACFSALYALVLSFMQGDFRILVRDMIRYFIAMDKTWDNTLFDQWVTPAWFLPALFWARLFFWELSRTGKWFLPLCAVLSISMILIHPYVPTPLCLGRGVEALVFMALGRAYRQYRCPLWIKVVAIGCWIGSMFLGRIDLCGFCFHCIPIDIVGSCGGTLFVLLLAKGINRTHGKPFFAWCGKNSLLILCAHTMLYDINILHCAIKKLPFRIPETMYYDCKHLVTLCAAWIYSSAKNHLCSRFSGNAIGEK